MKNTNSFNRNNSLTPSAAGRYNCRITPRGSITSVGAILAGATLASSIGSNEVATQLVSPEGSLRRKDSKQQQNTLSTKGTMAYIKHKYIHELCLISHGSVP